MEQQELAPQNTSLGWPSEEEIRAEAERTNGGTDVTTDQHQNGAETPTEAEPQASEQEVVDTETGEVQEASPQTQAMTIRQPTVLPPLLQRRRPESSLDTIDGDLRMAKVLAASGVFPAAKDQAKAYAAILIGRDLGMGPAQALMSIEFGPQGKPMVSVHWQSAQIRRYGHDYRVINHSPTECVVKFYRRFGNELADMGNIGMTVTDAKKISVHDREQQRSGNRQGATLGDKWNWRAWTEDMLYAYVMRRGVRRHYPELLMGYGDTIDEEQALHEEINAQDAIPEVTHEQAEQAVDVLYGDHASPTART